MQKTSCEDIRDAIKERIKLETDAEAKRERAQWLSATDQLQDPTQLFESARLLESGLGGKKEQRQQSLSTVGSPAWRRRDPQLAAAVEVQEALEKAKFAEQEGAEHLERLIAEQTHRNEYNEYTKKVKRLQDVLSSFKANDARESKNISDLWKQSEQLNRALEDIHQKVFANTAPHTVSNHLHQIRNGYNKGLVSVLVALAHSYRRFVASRDEHHQAQRSFEHQHVSCPTCGLDQSAAQELLNDFLNAPGCEVYAGQGEGGQGSSASKCKATVNEECMGCGNRCTDDCTCGLEESQSSNAASEAPTETSGGRAGGGWGGRAAGGWGQ